MRPRPILILLAVLLAAAFAQPGTAQIEGDFPEVVIFATNSINIQQNVIVESGDVVANSPVTGPTLVAGFEAALGNKVNIPMGSELKADRLKVGNFATVLGPVFCNQLSDSTGTITCGPFPPPSSTGASVYSKLPLFKQAPSNGDHQIVGNQGVVDLEPGTYGDISVGLEGTINFTQPGIYNVRSITTGRKSNLNFNSAGATEVRVETSVNLGVEDNVNLAGPPARAVVFYVKGTGGAMLGGKSNVSANFYVPNGLLELPSNVVARGAFLGFDVLVGAKAKVSLDSFFVNLPPLAVNDTATTDEDTQVVIPVLANDSDPNGDGLSVNSVDDPTNGTATTDGTTVTYTPDLNFFGTDVFNYEVCDDSTAINNNNCSTATITVTVNSVNDPPDAVDDEYNATEDTPLSIAAPGVLNNDTDVENDPLSVSAADSASTNGGSVSVAADGSFSYNPAQDFCGDDTFGYTASDGSATASATVTIHVDCVNDAPVAVDDTASVDENNSVEVFVLANDTDVDNTPAELTVSLGQGAAASGSVTTDGTTVVYTPTQNFAGVDRFSYTVCDLEPLCDTAEVVVTVNDLGDPPTATFGITAVTNGDVNVDITLSGTDPNGDTLEFTLVSGPSAGIIEVGDLPASDLADPLAEVVVTYDPDGAGNVEDSFIFRVDDGLGGTDTAEVLINPGAESQPPPPLGEVKANDQLCETVTLPDGSTADQCDLETLQGQSVTILLTGAAPCADGFPTPGDPEDAEPCDGNGNDVPLTFSLPGGTTTAQGGTLSNLTQGSGTPRRSATVLYAPPSGFTGVDSFTFQVDGDVDGQAGGAGETATGTVQISVEPFTPPEDVVARSQTVATEPETPVLVDLSGGAGSGLVGGPHAPLAAGPAAGSSAPAVVAPGADPDGDVTAGRAEALAPALLVPTPDDPGVVVDANGTNDVSDADYHGITNNTLTGRVVSVTIDISSDPDAFWDFDGSASFQDATAPVITSSNAPGVTVTWTEGGFFDTGTANGIRPQTLTATFDPPLDRNRWIRFGADTDFFVSDPAPGGNFGSAPATVTVVYESNPTCVEDYVQISTTESKAICDEPGATTYTVLALPTGGGLTYFGIDPQTELPAQVAITSVPFQLPDSAVGEVTYTPNAGTVGEEVDNFLFEVSNGYSADVGTITVSVYGQLVAGDCEDNATLCDNGRDGGGQAPLIQAPLESASGPGLTVEVVGNGSVSTRPRLRLRAGGLGIVCPGACSARFERGDEVLLFARPNDARTEFAGWTGDCGGTTPMAAVQVRENTRCTATFRPKR